MLHSLFTWLIDTISSLGYPGLVVRTVVADAMAADGRRGASAGVDVPP